MIRSAAGRPGEGLAVVDHTWHCRSFGSLNENRQLCVRKCLRYIDCRSIIPCRQAAVFEELNRNSRKIRLAFITLEQNSTIVKEIASV